jgi:hypothetical protein
MERAAKKAESPRGVSKSDRQAKLKSLVGTNIPEEPKETVENPPNPPAEITPPAEAPLAPPAEAPVPATDTSATAKKKTRSRGGTPAHLEAVARWRATKSFAPTQVISILKPDAKKRKAGERFSNYRSGMTVKEYQDAMEAKGRKPRATMGDIRWDHAQGFIRVE